MLVDRRIGYNSEMYNILGLNFGHDGSAAVVRDGKLVCAIANERLSRVKKAEGVTQQMVEYVLTTAGLRLEDMKCVAFSSYFRSADDYIRVYSQRGEEAGFLLDLSGPQTAVPTSVQIGNVRLPGFFVHHHMGHSASAYYTSPFDRAACFTMDASRRHPEACSVFAYGEAEKLHYLLCPGLMIGNAYSVFTEKLGIGSGLTSAGTTMALASFGQPSRAAAEGWQHYGESFYERQDQGSDDVFIDLMWSELSGLPPHVRLAKEQSDTEQAMGIAASLEHVFEQTIVKAANELYQRTKNFHGENLCLSGGSFLSSVANMRVRRQTPFKNIHLFPACTDDGLAVGAALYVLHHLLGSPRVDYQPREYMFLGRSYPVTESGGRPYDPHYVAKALAGGKIVAFFQGGSEFGPRALGHRSIFADPRNPNMKDFLNQRVKHRQWYRPFAPIVLSEKAAEWFDIDFESKLMLFVAPIRQPDKIPAVAHIDGSARLQSLSRDDDPKVYELIQEFDGLTGVPIILNTSLNGRGEPIVETPDDAIRFFRTHEVDLLVLENRIFEKND